MPESESPDLVADVDEPSFASVPLNAHIIIATSMVEQATAVVRHGRELAEASKAGDGRRAALPLAAAIASLEMAGRDLRRSLDLARAALTEEMMEGILAAEQSARSGEESAS